MASHTAAARRRAHAGHRSTAVPRHHRRVSGPVARPVPAVALPAPARRQRTGVFERLKGLPEHRVVDGLLRGRAWIWVIGVMLGGIVAMQVSLLKLNAGISRSVEQAGTLERVNADLETDIARLSSTERIQATAAGAGMVTPPAGDVGYVRARPDQDPRLAADKMQPPSEEARQVMANGGRAVATPAPTQPIQVAAPTTPAATTVPPAPTPTPAPQPTPAPTPPAATAPATSASPTTGATAAP
jgi:hypothetical protein